MRPTDLETDPALRGQALESREKNELVFAGTISRTWWMTRIESSRTTWMGCQQMPTKVTSPSASRLKLTKQWRWRRLVRRGERTVLHCQVRVSFYLFKERKCVEEELLTSMNLRDVQDDHATTNFLKNCPFSSDLPPCFAVILCRIYFTYLLYFTILIPLGFRWVAWIVEKNWSGRPRWVTKLCECYWTTLYLSQRFG